MLPELPFQTVDGAHAQPDQFGGLDDAGAFGELAACQFNLLGLSARPAKLGAYNAAPGLKLTVPSQLVPDDLEARTDPLLDHAALELGESAGDLEQQLAMWRGRIEMLLIEIEVDADSLEVLDCLQQVSQGPPQPVYRPGNDDVEPAPSGILEHAVEPWSLIASLRTADAGIPVDLLNCPATALGNLPKLPYLVLNRLMIGADAHIKRRTLCWLGHWKSPRRAEF